MPQEPWHPRKDAKPDHVIQLNCGEVRTHSSYKEILICRNLIKLFDLKL